ncbi:MAG: hypothetical protein IPO09_09745 [Anaeromyxobacter sp.]|nr:hypothetical protein [Anaeromyxobacter sp.]MBL0278604.1 hypothetical protein [Anaeromyxobacter sp.]
MHPRVVVTLTAADLERERPNLTRGSVVGAGVAGLARGAFCDVDLVFPSGQRLTVPARAVLTSDTGTVFAFEAFDREALVRHLAAPAPAPEPAPFDEEVEGGREDHAPANVQERLRGLSVAEQLRVARGGSVTERVVLERLYGKIVWEALLRNTHVTVPEVARLARLGTLPRPLLELIVGNPAWLQVPQVRRALLANPRLTPDMVHKVLALLPRDELQLVPQITAYPAAVRLAAKALVKR